MKRIIVGLLAALSLAALGGQAAKADRLEDILKKGVVRIAVPLSALHTPDGTPDRPVDHPAHETRDAAPPARAAIRRDRSGNDTPDDTPSAATAITALAEQLRRAGLDLDALRAELATAKAEHAVLATLPARTYIPELIMMPPALQVVGQAIA